MASELKGKGLELAMIAFRENPELVPMSDENILLLETHGVRGSP